MVWAEQRPGLIIIKKKNESYESIRSEKWVEKKELIKTNPLKIKKNIYYNKEDRFEQAHRTGQHCSLSKQYNVLECLSPYTHTNT